MLLKFRSTNQFEDGVVPIFDPCQIITPLVEIAIWFPNPNPSPSPTPNPKPTNTRRVIIWQGSELGTTPELIVPITDMSSESMKLIKSINNSYLN